MYFSSGINLLCEDENQFGLLVIKLFFPFCAAPLGMAGGKYRSFLIHVKAVNERGTDEICNGGIRPVVRLPSLKHQSNKGYSLASLLAKVAAGKVRSSVILNHNNATINIMDKI